MFQITRIALSSFLKYKMPNSLCWAWLSHQSEGTQHTPAELQRHSRLMEALGILSEASEGEQRFLLFTTRVTDAHFLDDERGNTCLNMVSQADAFLFNRKLYSM